MALRAVDDHPKLARLKMLLKCGRGVAMGMLESTWHFGGRYTPQGNIGKYSDEEIEAWIEWEGEPGRLIQSLLTAGWLERSTEHRLIIHDWHDHADDATRLALKRKHLSFLTHRPDIVATTSGNSSEDVTELETGSGLPEPEPEPEPAKALKATPKATPKASPSTFICPTWIPSDAWAGFEEIRKKIRAPLTDRARATIIRELDKLREDGEDPAQVFGSKHKSRVARSFSDKRGGWWQAKAPIPAPDRHSGDRRNRGNSPNGIRALRMHWQSIA